MHALGFVILQDNHLDEWYSVKDCNWRWGVGKVFSAVYFKGDGSLTEFVNYDVLDKYDSNVFYIYAMDCDQKFRVWTMPKILFEVVATNGGSHFSHED